MQKRDVSAAQHQTCRWEGGKSHFKTLWITKMYCAFIISPLIKSNNNIFPVLWLFWKKYLVIFTFALTI